MPGLADLVGTYDDTSSVDTLIRPDKSAPAARPDTTEIDKLLGTSPDVTKGLADLKREELTEKSRAMSDMTRMLERDQRRAREQFEATGIQPGEFRKWDAQVESEKRMTDPIQAFGSLGSVFGILASAFTHAPMENALNASAAAMNSIKAGDKEAYDRAHEAWKENTDLAFKRHELQRQSYQDAITLLGTNMRVGEAKLRMLASQYGDAQTLFLLDHGMSKELIDLQEKRADAAVKMMQAKTLLEENGFQNEFIKHGMELNDNIQDPQQRAGANLALFRDARSSQGAKDFPMQALALKNAESIRMKGRPLDYEETTKAMREITEATTRRLGAAGTGAPTTSRINAQTLEAVKQDVKAEHPDWTAGQVGLEAERRFKQAAASPVTGNERLKQEAKIDQYDNALQAVDKIVDKVEKYTFSAGAAGKVTRLGERLSNVVGSKQTDRVQMMRDIEYLKSVAPQLILDRAGRPLAAEAGHINDIIAGLSMGDTNANTLRAMKEVKALLSKMRDDNIKRLEGDWKAPEVGTTPAPIKGGNAAPWLRDPIDK